MKKSVLTAIFAAVLIFAIAVGAIIKTYAMPVPMTSEAYIPSETSTVNFDASDYKRVESDDLTVLQDELNKCKKFKQSAVAMLESAKAFGYADSHPVIKLANLELLLAESNIKYYKEKIEAIEEQNRAEEAAAAQAAYEAEIISSTLYSASQFESRGVLNWNGWRWTWYSQQVLPGYGLSIPGRHVDENGYVCDENEYICLASSVLSMGTVLDTPFGKQGKIYDSGCAFDTIDVYVNW